MHLKSRTWPEKFDLLTVDDTTMWLNHLHMIKLRRKEGAKKAAATRAAKAAAARAANASECS